MAAARLGMSTDSEDVPQTAQGGEPITAQTPSSVLEDIEKALAGRMPWTSEKSASQVEGSKIEKGQMSAARDSEESDRPKKGSPARRGPASGSENRLSTLQSEDAEKFGEFFHEGKAGASPKVTSFEEDTILKRAPPDFALGQEHWLGLHDDIREKRWQVYHLVNPTSITEAEECTRMVEAISKTRKELSEKKAREVFEKKHALKREELQSRLDEAARQLWDYDRTRQGAEERIAGAEARVKELKAEAAAASRNQRETYDQYHRLYQEWRAEEIKSRRKFSATFHQDWVREPLKLPDFPRSVRHFKDPKLAEPQRSAAPPPANAEAARAEVSAWVGSTSERRPTQEARRTPQSRGLLAKFVDHSKTLGGGNCSASSSLRERNFHLPSVLRVVHELRQ